MFLTRKFSIPLCGITDNTPNYCVKGPVVHLSLCLMPSDTPITINNCTVASKFYIKNFYNYSWKYFSRLFRTFETIFAEFRDFSINFQTFPDYHENDMIFPDFQTQH